jgi:hypothetical protein
VTKDYRAVIVIDDTDHFAASGPDGKLDVEAISNLYHHGVRTLAGFDELDVIVAIQPHFQQVEPVTDVERRYNFEAVHVATLAADKDELTLSLVLGRRLRNANITATVDDLIHPQALAELQGVYFTASHDFRRVLECADEAARLAADDGADQIAPRHVQHVLEQR